MVPNKDNLAFGLPIVAYCDSMYTLCSSGKGGDTVGDVKGGITVKNGEQSMFCDVYCFTSSARLEFIFWSLVVIFFFQESKASSISFFSPPLLTKESKFW